MVYIVSVIFIYQLRSHPTGPSDIVYGIYIHIIIHSYTGWRHQDSVQLTYQWLISMVYGRHNYMTIVNGGYKP